MGIDTQALLPASEGVHDTRWPDGLPAGFALADETRQIIMEHYGAITVQNFASVALTGPLP